MNLSDLIRGGFDVQSKNHAEAVLARDFPGPLVELCGVLLDFRIRDVELIERGGGEAIFTRRLRRSLTDRNWPKRNIVIRKIVVSAHPLFFAIFILSDFHGRNARLVRGLNLWELVR